VAGTIYAIAEALGMSISADVVARLAVSVEPTDSTVFPGLAILDHRQATFFRPLGSSPALTVLAVDEGGTVDTLTFNSRDWRAALRGLRAMHREALELVENGLQHGNPRTIGAGATLSALAHQRILPKTLLPAVLALKRETGALGVCVAHSGTLLGLLLDPTCQDVVAVARYVRSRLPGSPRLSIHRLVDGGPRHVSVPTADPSERRMTGTLVSQIGTG
jgi:L-threonine kinase